MRPGYQPACSLVLCGLCKDGWSRKFVKAFLRTQCSAPALIGRHAGRLLLYLSHHAVFNYLWYMLWCVPALLELLLQLDTGASVLGIVRRREIDKNVDRLIDEFEVPRATSAPPHLQEGRWGAGPQLVRAHGQLQAQSSTMWNRANS